MSDMEKLTLCKLISESINTLIISAACKYLRLIECDKMLYTVAEIILDYSCILTEPFGRIIIEPAAFKMQRIGKIPVIKRYIRLYAIFQKLVYKVIVEVDAILIYLTRSVRKYPALCNGKSICFQSKLRHKADIFFISVIMVAGNITCAFIDYFSLCVSKFVPDVSALAVLPSIW